MGGGDLVSQGRREGARQRPRTSLGLMYVDGRGVPKDETQAVAWFRKSADQGDADAQANLGLMYKSGRGVPKDEAQAVPWYRKAVEQGVANAQFNLGFMYEYWTSAVFRRTRAQAAAWFAKPRTKATHRCRPISAGCTRMDEAFRRMTLRRWPGFARPRTKETPLPNSPSAGCTRTVGAWHRT